MFLRTYDCLHYTLTSLTYLPWDPRPKIVKCTHLQGFVSAFSSLNGNLESQGAQDRKNPLGKPSGRKTSSLLSSQSVFCFVQGLKGLG